MVPPAALCVHLCIGQAYAFSVFNLPLTKLIGITASGPGDWSIPELGWIFSIAIFVLGFSAAIFGRWVEEGGPRQAMFTSALCWAGGFVIAAIWSVRLPRVQVDASLGRVQRMVEGVRYARADRVVGRCLTTMVLFSFFCLPVAILMPVVAQANLGVQDRSSAYGFLYACFGAGAVAGALSIGTFLSRRPLETVIRVALGGFAVSLAAFGLLRAPAPAFPVVFLVGYCYFAIVTSLATVLQRRLNDSVRGRVMALWVMAFGGTVPLGALVGGWLADVTSVTAVLLGGALASGLLVLWADLRHPGAATGAALEGPATS